jgi:hypothetical protein
MILNTYAGAGRRPQSLACIARHVPCVLVRLALRAQDGAWEETSYE